MQLSGTASLSRASTRPRIQSPAPLEKEGWKRERSNFPLDVILVKQKRPLGRVAHSCNSSTQEAGVGW